MLSTPYNNTYKYNFPQGTITLKDHEVALGSVGYWYNWYNITSTLKNNTYQYTFPDGSNTDTLTVTVPDGNYTVDEFNKYLQWQMISDNRYLIDGSGNYVYFLEWIQNPTTRLVQLISYPVPTSLSGYTQPTGATWSLPSTATTPQVIIPSTNIATLLGFTAGTYPSTAQSSNYTVQGSTIGRFYPITAISVQCSWLYNNFSIPCTLLYSVPVGSTSVGTFISSEPANYAFVPIKDGIYTDVEIRLTDQYGNPISLIDTNINVQLVVRHKSEHI